MHLTDFYIIALINRENSPLKIIYQSGSPRFSDVDDSGSVDNGVLFVDDMEAREFERFAINLEAIGGPGGKETFDFPSHERKFGSAEEFPLPPRPREK